jgi:hypothetical protein
MNLVCSALDLSEVVKQGKGKANPIQASTGPDSSRRLRHLDVKTIST